MMKQTLSAAQRQSQIVSQSQVQFLHMLTMCNEELELWLDEQFNENPMLEQTYRNPSEPPYAPEPVFYEGNDLFHVLTEQLRSFDFSKTEWNIFQLLIEQLDEKGYFTADLDILSTSSRLPLPMLERALLILQELEPYGIFSKNTADCLIKQLEKRQQNDPLLTKIIQQDLTALLMKKFSPLQKKYHISSGQLEQYHSQLAGLNPYPLFHFENQASIPVIPDILCRFEQGDWIVELNSNSNHIYTLSGYYQTLMNQTAEKELQQYLYTQYQSARNLILNIEKRQQTLLKITRAILQKQPLFFTGKSGLVPMSMSQITELCDVSISTISRAVHAKYLQYPGGMIRMKDLFAASSDTQTRTDISLTPNDVKELISSLIHCEDPKHPFSDDEISARLAEQDIQISRRTVTKYRKELFIPTSRERRRLP